MEAVMSPLVVTVVGLLVVFALPLRAVCTLMQLSNRTEYSMRPLAAPAVAGFLTPILMLLAWEFWLHRSFSLNPVLFLWMLFIVAGTVATYSNVPRRVKGFFSGLLLGCTAFLIAAIWLAALD
jgi:hypothetical protein